MVEKTDVISNPLKYFFISKPHESVIKCKACCLIDHFNTRPVTTLNYSAITKLHTLQITTAHGNSFQSAVSSPVVPW
jgi:hypothetical protein